MSSCRICGRPLSNPASVASGIGPICGSRNYRGRISLRFGSSLGGWTEIEAWEKVNHPCYSCKFFEFPTKGNEIETPKNFRVEMHGLVQEFPKDAIGGFCKKVIELVDGNLINEGTACGGRDFITRRKTGELPEIGLLQDRSGQIELFEL